MVVELPSHQVQLSALNVVASPSVEEAVEAVAEAVAEEVVRPVDPAVIRPVVDPAIRPQHQHQRQSKEQRLVSIAVLRYLSTLVFARNVEVIRIRKSSPHPPPIQLLLQNALQLPQQGVVVEVVLLVSVMVVAKLLKARWLLPWRSPGTQNVLFVPDVVVPSPLPVAVAVS